MKPHPIRETQTPRTFRHPDGREHKSVRQNWFDAVHEAAAALGCDPAEVREVMVVDSAAVKEAFRKSSRDMAEARKAPLRVPDVRVKG